MNNFILSGQVSVQGITLDWPAVANAAHYEVRRREVPFRFEVIGIAQKASYFDKASDFDEGAFAGVEYVYRVRALLENNESLDTQDLELEARGPSLTKTMSVTGKGIQRT